MSRIATTNYQAAPETLFQWATDDNDPFDRELDMSFVARALEDHDHTTGRGVQIPEDGIANGAITVDKLGAGAVSTAKIADDAVTAAKIAADAVGASEIAAGAVGTSELADDAVTAAKIAPDSVGASEIVAGGVGTSEIADSAVTTAKLNDDAVTAAKIASGAVGTAEIADDAVTAAKIAADAVGASEIAAGAVGTAELADDAVTAAKIAANAVGSSELADNAVDTGAIADDAVTEAKLYCLDAPANDEVLTYDSGTGKFEWQAVSALVSASAGSRVGDTKMFSGYSTKLADEAAAGWLNCDGSAVSRTTYANLYTVLGGASSPWGQGNGSTTFNLPDFRNFFPMGAGSSYSVGSTGGVSTLPNHVHTATNWESGDSTAGTGTSNRYDIDDTGNQFYIRDEGHHHYTSGTTSNPTSNPSILNPYKGVYFLIYSGVAS